MCLKNYCRPDGMRSTSVGKRITGSVDFVKTSTVNANQKKQQQKILPSKSKIGKIALMGYLCMEKCHQCPLLRTSITKVLNKI